jgi:putative oxidoreductase
MADGTGLRKSKMNYALWIAQALLALIFLFAGVTKLITPIEEMTQQIALPGWFLRFTGIVEILGGLGVVLPWLFGIRSGLTPLAAAALVIVMICAVALTVAMGGGALVLIPFSVGVLAAFVAYGRWRLVPYSG